MWRNQPSKLFLQRAVELVRSAGFEIVNLDATYIGERPKIMVRSAEIREFIAETLQCKLDQVSVKATTQEQLGSIGAGEGAMAMATVSLVKRP
jgi:2-C-methyl-D-erythritol 2,4-cyclodiphosphate synthase